MSKDTYYVWRRSDGYVGATCNRMPADYVSGDRSITTFVGVGRFDDWGAARDRILEERVHQDFLLGALRSPRDG